MWPDLAGLQNLLEMRDTLMNPLWMVKPGHLVICVDQSLAVRGANQMSQPMANSSVSKVKESQTAGRDQRSRLGEGAETQALGY